MPLDDKIENLSVSSDYLLLNLEAMNQEHKVGDTINLKDYYGELL